MTKNNVFLLDNDIIEVQVQGDQTVCSVQKMADQMNVLAERQRTARKPVLVVDNLLSIGEVTPEGRKLVVEIGKTADYDKIALVGNGVAIRLASNLMLRAIGKANKLRYFDNYDKALTWLKVTHT